MVRTGFIKLVLTSVLLVLTGAEIERGRSYAWGEVQRDRHVAFHRALESLARDM